MSGRIALATGVCGKCGAQVYRPSAEEISSPLCLPLRNDFVARVKIFNRKIEALLVIWSVGLVGALAMPRIMVEGSVTVEMRAIDLRLKLLQNLSALIFFVVLIIYFRWRRRRLAKEAQLACPNCAELVASDTVIATGKCWNCECRIYTREA